MGKRPIFYVCSCDVWVSRDSTRLEFITTSVKKLKSFIAKKIRQGDYEYGDPDRSKTYQAKMFMQDFDAEDRSTINGKLSYGFYDYTYDGEEI